MKNVLGITIALALTTTGMITVVKSRNADKAEARQVASRKAFGAKLARSTEAAKEARDAARQAEREEASKVRERWEATPEGKLTTALVTAGQWVGLRYNFNNTKLRNDALYNAEQNGYTLGHPGLVPFLVIALRAKEKHPDWSAEQCIEAGKIAATAMRSLGDNYHPNSVFIVVDDVVKFEILNQDNRNLVTALIAVYARYNAVARRHAA